MLSPSIRRETALAHVEFAPTPQLEPSRTDARWLRGESQALVRLCRHVDAIGSSGFTGLVIHGEPGTGKRELAGRLHLASDRAERPMAYIDARDESSVERARALSAGLRADNGVSPLPGNLVVEHAEAASDALVGALLELTVASGSASSGCGLLLLSSASLETLRKRSLSMGQLLGRAASAVLRTPALRERPEDIAELAQARAAIVAELHGLPGRRVSDQAIARLTRHDFRGNCRELDALVELAALRAAGDWITEADFSLPEAEATEPSTAAEVVIRMPGSSLRDIELQAIRVALRVTGGRLVRAAEMLGITRHALRRKLEKYGLSELRARPPSDPAHQVLDEDSYI